jgi:CRISPR-associated endonuclease Csn1
MLSSRFMIECSEIMMKEHLRYDEAVKKMGFHHSDKYSKAILHSLPYYGKILASSVTGGSEDTEEKNPEKRYGRIPNPTVHIALNQLRKLVNALTHRFGNPSEIILEINRELKQSKARKDEIAREQTKNQKVNERIRKELTELGLIHIGGEDIKKYKLWEELADEGLARRCPYCGKVIAGKDVITGNIEIEHILPYSRTLLNTRDNLTVAHRACNQAKGDRSPYEAFGNSPSGFDWNLITELALKLPRSKRYKFSPDAMDRFQEKEGGFMDKQLTDTAYLSRAGKDYLAAICDKNKIWVSTGKLTSMLRVFWGFNTFLNKGHDTWFKNRSDHRHHALDSLAIALCDRGLVAKAAAANSHRGYGDMAAPPCPIPRAEIEKWLKTMLISIKPDHGKEGKLYAETALAKHSYAEEIKPGDLNEKEINRIIPKTIQQDIAALVQQQGFTKARKEIAGKYKYLRVFRDKWVSRKDIAALKETDLERICDTRIRIELQKYINAHPAKEFAENLLQFSKRTGINSVRYFPKDQTPLRIKSVPNKYYMTEDFYRVDVWKVPIQQGKFKYEGVFVPRPKAADQNLYGDEDDQLQKPHPAAKMVMRLHKNDVIELSNDNTREFCRIAGYATTRNNLDIRPIYASDTIAAWFKDTNVDLTSPFWPHDAGVQYFKSVNVLFSEYRVKLVKITIDGRVFYRST